jgi:hypothetical protein
MRIATVDNEHELWLDGSVGDLFVSVRCGCGLWLSGHPTCLSIRGFLVTAPYVHQHTVVRNDAKHSDYGPAPPRKKSIVCLKSNCGI